MKDSVFTSHLVKVAVRFSVFKIDPFLRAVESHHGGIALKQLQDALDDYLKEHSGEIDYIHGTDTLKNMAQSANCIGFIAPTIGKDNLFSAVSKEGLLPRKAFSVGEAADKRYYLETRVL